MTFIVYGPPVGKQRPRVAQGHAYTPKKTVEYEAMVRREFERQVDDPPFPKGVPLAADITAYYPIPKSESKKTAEKMLSCEIRPTKKPDFDNVGKIICDSLNGYAYHDDSQIVEASVSKFYSLEPRVEVTIYAL